MTKTLICSSKDECPRRPETGAVGIGNPDDHHITSQSFRRIAFATLALIVLVVIPLTIIGLVVTVSASDNSDRVAQGTQIASCRSLAHVPVDAANDRVQSLILVVLASPDRTAYEAAIQLDPPADIAKAKAEAQKNYEAAVRQSVDDPATFLAHCRTGGN